MSVNKNWDKKVYLKANILFLLFVFLLGTSMFE